MVYTITFNPSLDYFVGTDNFRLGYTNRTTSELMLPGGKGLNVSTVLSSLGIPNTAIYFSAGFVGQEITRLIRESGINTEEIRLTEGCSRINVKFKSVEGTEINAAGPSIPEEAINELWTKVDNIKNNDTLVLAGSIPASMPETMYSDIIERLEGRGIRVVVDASGKLLLNVLKYKPFLVKPNLDELGELFGVEIKTKEAAITYAKQLLDMGAENVIVSMAGDGAFYISGDREVLWMDAPKGTLVNGVGAGDSMVAGFIAGYLETGDPRYAFKLGVSAGSASAFSEHFPTKDQILAIFDTLKKQWWFT